MLSQYNGPIDDRRQKAVHYGGMIQRECPIPASRSCLLLGPRQTGKSTLIRSILPETAWTVDLLNHDSFLEYSKDPSLFRTDAEARIKAGVKVIFVDEIQKVPTLLDEIHGLLERHRIRFLLTGSSARKLVRGGANLLAGRASMRRLHPLTMSEMGENFDLARTLRFGSLPPVVTGSDTEAREILDAYARTYIREEIQQEAVVRNLGGFGRFLDVAAFQCGDLLNVSSVARDASLAARTVQDYYQILEDTLMGFRLEAWRKSVRARLVAHPRIYLFDTGIANALNRRLTAPFDPALLGRLFEQWIVLECHRAIDYRQSEARIFFWRTNHGAEVDLLIEKHGKLRVAAEIKFKKRFAGADVAGLRSFAEAEPQVPRVVVSLADHPQKLGDIEVLPYGRFFARLDEWL